MNETKGTVNVDAVSFDVAVIVASGSMSAADVARARRAGKITMETPAGRKVLLETGGVILAEGIIKRKQGRDAFVVTKMLEGGKEAVL